MIFVHQSDLSPCELSSLGNNILPGAPRSRSRTERANRRVLAGVNRSLATLNERVDRLHRVPARPKSAIRALAV